jgi:glycosyltransferase involved in cell wall biosynthesis
MICDSLLCSSEVDLPLNGSNTIWGISETGGTEIIISLMNIHMIEPDLVQDRRGWPWNLTTRINPSLPEGNSFPRITIITPSYNQAGTLEETIRSVLLQGYPNLEYMVIDGGSTDNSVEIIRKYEPWITYWVSEKDRGQAHAINKGFERCTGDLVGWLNSDDLLAPGALFALAEAYLKNPQAILLGYVDNFIDGSDKKVSIHPKNISASTMVLPSAFKVEWQQPGVYVPASKFKDEGLFLDESLRYVFDLDWMCRILQKADVFYLKKLIALFRLHNKSKTVGEKAHWLPEYEQVFSRYWQNAAGSNPNWLLARFELFRASVRFGAMTWEPEIARQHLKSAAIISPEVILSFRFIELSLRSLIPKGPMMWIRSIYGCVNPIFRMRQ